MPDIQSNLGGAEKKVGEGMRGFEKIKFGNGQEKTEAKSERAAEKIDNGTARQKVLEEIAEAERGVLPVSAIAGSISPQLAARQKEIEKALEAGLEEIYLHMSPEKQKEFARAGEETSREINNLLSRAKIKVKKIIELIKKWLSLIPGVNKFFLEQEAKIKADEILKIKR